VQPELIVTKKIDAVIAMRSCACTNLNYKYTSVNSEQCHKSTIYAWIIIRLNRVCNCTFARIAIAHVVVYHDYRAFRPHGYLVLY